MKKKQLQKSFLNSSNTEKNQQDSKSSVFRAHWLQSLAFKLYGGLFLFVAFILIVSFFSWKSLLEVVDIQKIIIGEDIPELILSAGIVQQSEKLIQSAPQLISSSAESSLIQIKKDIQKENQTLQKLITQLEKSQKSLQMKEKVQKMVQNLTVVEQSVSQKIKRVGQIQNLSFQITKLSRAIHKILVIEIDNKTFNFALKSKAVGGHSPEKRNIQLSDILLYRRLLNLQTQTNISFSLLREALNLSNADLIQPIRERFVASISSCEQALKSFPPSYKELKENIQLLKQAGLKTNGIFSLKRQVLDIEKTQNEYLVQNKQIAGQLADTVKKIKQNIQKGGDETTHLFEQSLKKNQTLFFIINGISLFGSLILAFFFIGPLIRRLTYLSNKMKNMSQGRLQEPVQVTGADEVKEMASALEVFRRHSLSAQRLDLAEKLAQEVQEKNKILKETINDLNKTRGKLVIQEKLASLGQLTSGIAHEIKNPLNFINNFSKLSKNLAVELKEELKKESAASSNNSAGSSPENSNAYQKNESVIYELLEDIQSNMEKISSHGERANDIIMGMLQHSREASSQKEFVDINKFMDTYSNLAFHSQRSLDSNFNVVFKKDYDSSLQPISAVPQDISRIILNIITNACDAVKEKQNSQNNVIYLKTQKEKNQVKIVIRDNGSGMPDSVKEKIFNPFFTTKTTGQGTGLGLSLVHDIVTKYGGSITAESQKGKFTEFTVILPLQMEKSKTQLQS